MRQNIGIFDSGVGGLSIFQKLNEKLNANFIYIADNAFVPYGDKPKEFIEYRAEKICNFLIDSGVDKIIIACNTVTMNAYQHIKNKFLNIDVFGVEPEFADDFDNLRVAIMATSNTITSQALTNKVNVFLNKNKNSSVLLQACPNLVEFIEETNYDKDFYELLTKHTQRIKEQNTDVLLLGCTHYNFISAQIKHILPNTKIIFSGDNVLKTIEHERRFGKNTALFFSTGNTNILENQLNKLLSINAKVIKASI